jgi:hypothetical protein
MSYRTFNQFSSKAEVFNGLGNRYLTQSREESKLKNIDGDIFFASGFLA